LKFCIIGSNTKLSQQFGRLTADEAFNRNYLPTIGTDKLVKYIEINNQPIKLILEVINTHGFFRKQDPTFYQGGFKILPGKNHTISGENPHYLGARAVMFIFEKKDRKTFEKVPEFHEEFKNVVPNPVPVAIVGIISDSAGSVEILTEEGESLARRLNGHYFETEIANKTQIEKILHTLTESVVIKVKRNERRKDENRS
jgi:hypothetical protein